MVPRDSMFQYDGLTSRTLTGFKDTDPLPVDPVMVTQGSEGTRLTRERGFEGYTPGGVGPLPAPDQQGRRPMTMGEYRVGIEFNPGGRAEVYRIKRLAADLIDMIYGLPFDLSVTNAGEVSRLKALAMTEIESGAMWAVKAATKPPMT